jgi:hypothetical protein
MIQGWRCASAICAGFLILSLHPGIAQNQPAVGAVIVTTEQQKAPDVAAATRAGQILPVQVTQNVETQWQQWLKANGFTEGAHQLPDGRKLILTSGSAVVRANPGSARWVAARNLAVDQAELDAKKNLAEFIDVEIKSNRLVELATQGGETPPPMMAETVDELSIAEKARVLTSSALGNPTSATVASNGIRTASYNYASMRSQPQNFIPYVGPLVAGYDQQSSSVSFTFDQHGVLTGTTSSQSGMGTGTNLAAGSNAAMRPYEGVR